MAITQPMSTEQYAAMMSDERAQAQHHQEEGKIVSKVHERTPPRRILSYAEKQVNIGGIG